MLKQTNFGFLIHEIVDMWVRWKKGYSLSDIGRAVGKHPGSINTAPRTNHEDQTHDA